MIKYLIIDDEHIAHDIIKGYCDLLPNLIFEKSCYDGLEALQYLNEHEVDLLFLDLNIPKLKGFEFLRTLTARPKVIVTTAYSEFALEGYELNVVDYLLKPFGFERFLTAINKAMGTLKPNTKSAISDVDSRHNTIFLKSDKKYVQLNIAEILFIEAAGNYTKVVTRTETTTIREKISDLLKLLPDSEFIQSHKSFAVAKKHIRSIEGNQITLGDHVVPVGKVYRMNISEMLG
jgi:DNA-binding LytR/AlgR family response regulator